MNAPPHQEEPAEMVWAFSLDVSWTLPWRGALDMSNRKEARETDA